jgi:hypothetical protein
MRVDHAEAGTETLEWDRLEEALQANKTRSHQTLDATQQETLPCANMPLAHPHTRSVSVVQTV